MLYHVHFREGSSKMNGRDSKPLPSYSGNDNNHYCSFAAFSASIALIISFTS